MSKSQLASQLQCDDDLLDVGFDVDSFLIPWRRVLLKWESETGVSSIDEVMKSKLHESASKVYAAAFDNPGEVPSEDVIRNAEWLLEMLAPGGGEDPESHALIPDSFWSRLAGRAIVAIMKAGMPNVFLPMKEAAAYLGVEESRLYHLALTRRIPCYIDSHERNFRVRRRFRVDQLQTKYPIIYKAAPGSKSGEEE